jgi:hypothetical protein
LSQKSVNLAGAKIPRERSFQFRRIDVRRRITLDPILLRQESEKITQRNQMTSHASSAQSLAIKGGKEAANIISVGIRQSLPPATQESAKMDKVPSVIRDTIGRQALFHPRVVKVVVEFAPPRFRIQAMLPPAKGSPASHFVCRLRIKVVCCRSVFLLSFASAGHSRHFPSGV